MLLLASLKAFVALNWLQAGLVIMGAVFFGKLLAEIIMGVANSWAASNADRE